MVGVNTAEAALRTLESFTVQELSVSAISIIGAVAPVAISSSFMTKVIYLVAPAGTWNCPSQFLVVAFKVICTSCWKAFTPKSVLLLITIQTLNPTVTAGSLVASELVASGIANKRVGVE